MVGPHGIEKRRLRRVVVAPRQVGDGDVAMRRGVAGTDRQRTLILADRGRRVALPLARVAEVDQDVGVGRIERERLLERRMQGGVLGPRGKRLGVGLDSFLGPAKLLQGGAEIDPGVGEIRRDGKRLLEAGERFLVFAFLIKYRA